MSEDPIKEVKKYHPADTNGDGKVSKKEQEMFLEFKRTLSAEFLPAPQEAETL